jgi:uncharacterized membrane protein YqjE
MSADNDTERHELRDESIAELVKRLAEQTNTLVKQEIELAKAELTQKGRIAAAGAAQLGAAALIALLALGALTACLIALLQTAIDHTWLSALIVAVAYAAIAAPLALRGRERIRRATPPAPEKTIESVKEDVAWAKTRTRSAMR